MTDRPVAYFAFGANMARRVIVKRRGLHPVTSEAAVLEGYALRFVLRGLPGLEPAFASAVACEGARIHGVLHLLPPSDMRRLDRLESAYDRVPVVVHTAHGDVEASTYVARRPRPTEGMPSRRYLGLLIEGAREHGLPAEYVAELEARRAHHLPLVSSSVALLLEGAERALQRIRRR